MTRRYKTALVITGDAEGGIKAVRATEAQLKKLDQANKRSTKNASRLSQSYAAMSRSAAKYGSIASAAALGAGSSLIALTAHQAAATREAATLAQTIGTTTGNVQAFQYAAEQAGIASDKATDILKDLTDKLGDASLNQGGELYQALQRIGLSATELQKLSPTEQLIRISDAIKSLPRAEQVNVLESIADDGSKLLPILDNGAAALRKYTDQARRFGVALSDVDNRRLIEADRSMRELRGLATGLGNQLAIAVAPAISDVADDADDLAATFKDPAFQQGVTTIADGTASLAKHLATSVSEIGKLANAVEHTDWSAMGKFLFDRTGPGFLWNNVISKTGFDDFTPKSPIAAAGAPGKTVTVTGTPPANSGADSGGGNTSTAKGLLAQFDKRHQQLVQLRKDREQLQAAIAKDPEQAPAYRRALTEVNQQIANLSKGSTSAAGALTDQQQAAKQLASTYESTAASIQKQITLFGKDGQAAQTRYELEHGELAKLSPERKAHLQSMADELDQLNAQKDAVQSLFPEWQKLEQAKQLKSSVSDLPQNMQAFGQRRAAQLTKDAATQGLPQMQGLDPEYNGAFGEANRLSSERDQYEQAYQQRLDAFRQYAATHKEEAATAHQAIEALEKDHQQRIVKYDDQMAKARLAGTSDLFGNLAEATRGFAGENSSIYRDMFATSKAFAIANAALGIKNAIVSALSLPFPANLAAGAVAAGEAVSLIGDVKSITMGGGGAVGQAHDGIDSVPATGTWNLEKGERVVDQRTNQDLKRYLAKAPAAAGQRGANNQRPIQVTNTITVQSHPNMTAEQSRQQGEQVGQGIRDTIRGVLVDEQRPGGILQKTG
ncbi:hypothetical protein [Salinisphaera sp. Q1T1-3]|uniref:hypothetical protein n=1 Tax=Salinisphaera sp. Q1T1-3 TaxID=2321229 RepID=UPI000E747E3D|nr:hypothetical protein [Salinisphaera sp. Q1T1-3]RJS95287.1 hypothetical protein D3260_01675 [Salinisphaera sp. Q1T1-3]